MVDPVRIISKDWPPPLPPAPPAGDYNPRRHSERIKARSALQTPHSFRTSLVETIKCWSSWDFSCRANEEENERSLQIDTCNC